MKLARKVLVLVAIITFIASSQQQSLHVNNLYQQKEAFPDQFQAATNSTALEKANYTNPTLSHILFEEDPTRKLRKNEFAQQLRFSQYRLTLGETESIFRFADADRDDLLSQKEWDTFTSLYIYPFEACDSNHDYLLEESEFANCWDRDPRTRFVVFRRRDNKVKYYELMWTVSSRARAVINFHDYMFIRRALFAWKQCQSSSKYISKSAFRCAVRTALLQKTALESDKEVIYDTGLKYLSGNELNLIEMDFVIYLRTLFCTYAFTALGSPTHSPYIEYNNFLRSVKEDRVPHNFQEEEVKLFYSLINTNPVKAVQQMNFPSFAFFWNLHFLFNKYSVEAPLQLTNQEYSHLIDDQWFPRRIRYAIDNSLTNFSEAQYQEASLVLQRKRLNENSLYFSFKQDASANNAALWNETTVNNTYYNVTRNDTSRDVFFTIWSEVQDRWSKESYYRSFQLAHLFTSLVPDSRHIVPAVTFMDHLLNQYTLVNPPVSYNQRANYPMYKNLPREVNIDVLIFSAIENYRHRFQQYTRTGVMVGGETLARLITQQFGMREIPASVFDVAFKGFDQMRRRLFNLDELMKNCLVVQAVAAEHERNERAYHHYNLKSQMDNARKYPNWPRRNQATPWV